MPWCLSQWVTQASDNTVYQTVVEGYQRGYGNELVIRFFEICIGLPSNSNPKVFHSGILRTFVSCMNGVAVACQRCPARGRCLGPDSPQRGNPGQQLYQFLRVILCIFIPLVMPFVNVCTAFSVGVGKMIPFVSRSIGLSNGSLQIDIWNSRDIKLFLIFVSNVSLTVLSFNRLYMVSCGALIIKWLRFESF